MYLHEPRGGCAFLMHRKTLHISGRESCPRRVLFVNANETARPYRVAPLGLAFVASATERAGHQVRFVDLPQTHAGRRAWRRALRLWQPDYVALSIRNLDNSDFHALETYLESPAALIREARHLVPTARII